MYSDLSFRWKSQISHRSPNLSSLGVVRIASQAHLLFRNTANNSQPVLQPPRRVQRRAVGNAELFDCTLKANFCFFFSRVKNRATIFMSKKYLLFLWFPGSVFFLYVPLNCILKKKETVIAVICFWINCPSVLHSTTLHLPHFTFCKLELRHFWFKSSICLTIYIRIYVCRLSCNTEHWKFQTINTFSRLLIQ